MIPISATAALLLRFEAFGFDLGIGKCDGFSSCEYHRIPPFKLRRVGHSQHRRPAVIPRPASGRGICFLDATNDFTLCLVAAASRKDGADATKCWPRPRCERVSLLQLARR